MKKNLIEPLAEQAIEELRKVDDYCPIKSDDKDRYINKRMRDTKCNMCPSVSCGWSPKFNWIV